MYVFNSVVLTIMSDESVPRLGPQHPPRLLTLPPSAAWPTSPEPKFDRTKPAHVFGVFHQFMECSGLGLTSAAAFGGFNLNSILLATYD